MDYPRAVLDILNNVLESFADYGMISDFVLHEHEKFFIVQYGNIGGLKNFMKYRYSTPDNDLRVIKKKLEICAETWTNLTLPNPSLELQLTEFLKETTPTEDGMKSSDDALKDLIEVLRDRFRNCTTHPFGSYITHLGDDDSDIDV